MKCPDCGQEINEVVVERFQTRTFVVNHETQEIIPKPDHNWEEPNDYAYHCPRCDSLNVDSMLRGYNLKQKEENPIEKI